MSTFKHSGQRDLDTVQGHALTLVDGEGPGESERKLGPGQNHSRPALDTPLVTLDLLSVSSDKSDDWETFGGEFLHPSPSSIH